VSRRLPALRHDRLQSAVGLPGGFSLRPATAMGTPDRGGWPTTRQHPRGCGHDHGETAVVRAVAAGPACPVAACLATELLLRSDAVLLCDLCCAVSLRRVGCSSV